MIDGTMTNPNHPRLSFRLSLKQPFGSRNNIVIDFKISGFDVDRHNPTRDSGEV
jgi:hypothetical protein